MLNEAFGWCWIVLGMLSGAVLGLGFAREGFLGGYASWPRRMLRLGHVAFFMLGALNVLFAMSIERAALSSGWSETASWALIIGAIFMPATCIASAFKPAARNAFALPVIALLLGAGITAVGLIGGVS